ncbi:MAG: LysM domain-containing protein [Anaerolineales bacterium]
MKKHTRHSTLSLNLRLILLALVVVATSVVCSSGYITPASLTETAQFTPENTLLPTVQFIRPTSTETPLPTATATMDPSLASPTPIFDTPTPSPTPQPTATQIAADTKPLQYFAQSGDTLMGLATRFNVHPFEIVSDKSIPDSGFISPGQMLMIPLRLVTTTSNWQILPDSEVVFSPSTIDFLPEVYIETIGGYLSDYTQYVSGYGILTGAEIVEMVAYNHSINPRVLLQTNFHWLLQLA